MTNKTERYYFYFWMFRVEYNKVLKYNLHKKESFTDIETILRNDEFVNSVQKLLISLDRIHNVNVAIDAKKFLSCFMMHKFPEMINYTPERDDLSKCLYKCCESLISRFTELDDYMKRVEFLLSLGKYKTVFEKFKDQDRLDMLESLILTLLELEDSYKNRENKFDEDTLKCIKCEIDKTMRRIKQFKGLEVLKSYREKELELKKKIEENMKKAFWDTYSTELEKDEPNYSVVIPLLTELMGFIEKCVPKNTEFIEEFNERIDIEFIQDLIDEEVITKSELTNTTEYIIDTIKKLHSPVNDESLEIWRMQLREEESTSDYLINFFKGAFSRVETILVEKNTFIQTMRNNKH